MNENGLVAAGVDTHKDTHALCVIDCVGRILRAGTYPANLHGYDELAEAIGKPGECVVVGVEGTGSYGAGLTRRLVELGFDVVEVVRPKRDRRRVGTDKNDLADAERAAHDALAKKASGAPKAGNGWVEALRYRMAARDAAVRTSTSAANTAHAIIVTAPFDIREELSGLNTPSLMKSLVRRRARKDELESALWDSLRALAIAWTSAKKAAADQEAAMRKTVATNAPALIDMYCCGTISAAKLAIAAGDNPGRMRGEAAFASLCGASPIEASSGRVKRYRLNRGGDRQANRALHTIARLRMKGDSRTKAYMEKRTKEGKTRREIERCLVRFIAREAYHALTHPLDTTWYGYRDFAVALKKKRVAAGITQAEIAAAIGVASARISEVERAVRCDEDTLIRYRECLNLTLRSRSETVEKTS